VENLNLCRTVLTSGMLLNPIPYVSHSYDLYIRYVYFSIIVIPALAFIISTALTLNNNKHRKFIGRIFLTVGIIELFPLVSEIISQVNQTSMLYLQNNLSSILFMLGVITIAGGVAHIIEAKPNVMLFMIMMASTPIMGAFLIYLIP
jgi:hypothetical protein